MPFHKPLVQEHQQAQEERLARQREAEAAENEFMKNMEARTMARMQSRLAFPTEEPPSPMSATDEFQSSPTLAADKLQSGAALSMPAPATEQLSPPVRSQDAQSAKGCDSVSRVRRQASQHPATPPGHSKHKCSASPDAVPPPTSKARILSPVVECENRLVGLQPADSTPRPIATPARRPDRSLLQCGLAVPRCETEVQDQLVANESVANPPAVPIAASQAALVAFEPEAAGNSGAGQLLAKYYSMLASCTTQVACAY